MSTCLLAWCPSLSRVRETERLLKGLLKVDPNWADEGGGRLSTASLKIPLNTNERWVKEWRRFVYTIIEITGNGGG